MTNIDLSQVPEDVLKKELENRASARSAGDKPLAVAEPDFTTVRSYCQKYIDALDDAGWVDDDLSHYIFEAAMVAVFGKNVWVWVNARHSAR